MLVSFGPFALYNKPGEPLIVSSPAINAAPPTVVYTHTNSTAVKMYLKDPGMVPGTGGPITWGAGELFGYLTLAGHGTDTTCASFPGGPCGFYGYVTTQVPEMPLPNRVPSLTGWGLAALLLLMIVAAVWIYLKRRAGLSI